MSDVQFAKKHIRNRFSLLILPHISEGLWSVYENARTVCEKNHQIEQTIRTFQNLLTFIPKWDETRLNAEVERIQTASGCSYLEELLTATLITYLRAFAAVQYATSKEMEVEFERPPLPRFIHELYKEAARQSWTHAYLFKTYGVSSEQQARNRRDIGTLLDTALDTTFDAFLPWKAILDKYFKEPTPAAPAPTLQTLLAEDHDEEEDHHEEEESLPKKGVSFEAEAEAEDEEEEGGAIVLSNETVDLNVETLGAEEEEKEETGSVALEPTEDLVLNL
jgi:hypothetical protein